MQSRNRYVGVVLAVLLFMGMTAATEAVEYHIRKGTSGGTYFSTLEELRIAIMEDNTVTLRDGDVIILYNDDATLKGELLLPWDAEVTIKSADGATYTITPHREAVEPISFYTPTPGGTPSLNIENVVMDGLHMPTYFAAADGGKLTVSNTVIQNSDYGLILEGDLDATLTNVIFRNNSLVNAISITNSNASDTTTVNVILDGNSPCYVAWDNEDASTHTAISLQTYTGADLNFDIAAGRKLMIEGGFYGNSERYQDYNVTKTGAGTLKLNGYVRNYDAADYLTDADAIPDIKGGWNFHIKEGTLEFGKYFRIYDPLVIDKDINDNDYVKKAGAAIKVDSGATIKVNITPGDIIEQTIKGSPTFTAQASRFNIGTFNSVAGSRLEVGGISLMPELGPNSPVIDGDKTILSAAWYGLFTVGNPGASSVAGMSINNKLMEAALELCDLDNLSAEDPDPESYNGIRLHVKRVNNLSTLTGVGTYADVYRKLDTLTEEERDILDSIYARGGTDGESLGYLQSLGGGHVMYSSVAMRHNWAGVLRAISRRTTAFQKEELEEEMAPTVTGSNFCYNDAAVNRVKYGQIWAYMDKSYTDQDDADSLAGYKYAPAGIGIGYERHNDEWIYGGLVRYDSGDVKLKSKSSTRTEVESVIASIYGSYASEGYYVSGGLHYGHGWNKSYANFSLPCYSAFANTGEYATRLFGANVELGYMQNFEYGDTLFRFTPYAGLGYASIRRDSITEQGTGNQLKHYRQSQWDLWEASAGVRLAAPIEGEGYTIIPALDVSFSRTMGDPNNEHGDAHLLNNPASLWKITALGSNRSALRVMAGVNARFRDNIDVGVNYEFEWRKQYWSNQFGMNLTVGF